MSNSIKTYTINENDFIEIVLPHAAYIQSGDGVQMVINDSFSTGILLVNNTPFYADKGKVRFINNKSFKAVVNVSSRPREMNGGTNPDIIEVSDFTFIEPEYIINGTRRNPKIGIIPIPNDATFHESTFTSTDDSVIHFNDDGTFNVGKNGGTCTVTCTVLNPVSGKTVVKSIDIIANTNLKLTIIGSDSPIIEKGKEKTITYTLEPSLPRDLYVVNFLNNNPDALSVDEGLNNSVVLKASEYSRGDESVRIETEIVFRSCVVEDVRTIRISPIGGFVKCTDITVWRSDGICRGMKDCRDLTVRAEPSNSSGYTVEYLPYNNDPGHVLNQHVINLHPQRGTYSMSAGSDTVDYGYTIRVTNYDGTIIEKNTQNKSYAFLYTLETPPSTEKINKQVLLNFANYAPHAMYASLNLSTIITNEVWEPVVAGSPMPVLKSSGSDDRLIASHAGTYTFTFHKKFCEVLAINAPQTFTITFTEK